MTGFEITEDFLTTAESVPSFWQMSSLLSSLPSAVPTMRLSQDSSRLPFCLFFSRFTSPGSFWIFLSFRSSLT